MSAKRDVTMGVLFAVLAMFPLVAMSKIIDSFWLAIAYLTCFDIFKSLSYGAIKRFFPSVDESSD